MTDVECEGEHCHCDYCKCRHGYGTTKGYGKGSCGGHGYWGLQGQCTGALVLFTILRVDLIIWKKNLLMENLISRKCFKVYFIYLYCIWDKFINFQRNKIRPQHHSEENSWSLILYKINIKRWEDYHNKTCTNLGLSLLLYSILLSQSRNIFYNSI